VSFATNFIHLQSIAAIPPSLQVKPAVARLPAPLAAFLLGKMNWH
jgi:hypothetical protein